MSDRVSTETLKWLCEGVEDTEEVLISYIGKKDVHMKVRKHLSLEDYLSFAEDMINAEFYIDEETDKENYSPEIGSALFSYFLVKYYSNVNLPEDFESAYKIINQLDLDGKVLDIVGGSMQLIGFMDSVCRGQEYIKMQKTGLTGLLYSIKRMVEKFDANQILETLSGFDPEKLEMFKDLGELKNLFTEAQLKNNGANTPTKPEITN